MIVNMLCLILLVGTVVYLIVAWGAIPEKIPVHYGFGGNATRYGGRGVLIFVPIFTWILFGLLTILARVPEVWALPIEITDENKTRVFRIIKGLSNTIKLVLVGAFTFVTIYQSLAKALPNWFVVVFVFLMIAPIVFSIIKLYQAK
jgi:uncharacterized membrane protein